jgi:hypothetical protein
MLLNPGEDADLMLVGGSTKATLHLDHRAEQEVHSHDAQLH